MDANQVYLLLGIVVSAGAVLGGLIKAAGALYRIATTGTALAQAVTDNTTATQHLSTRFDGYQQVTDRRLEILEEAHRRRGVFR